MINLLNLGALTSGYGQRTSPTAGASSNHKGIDIVLKDKNVPAVLGGTVTKAGYSNSAGQFIEVEQSDGTVATYMHLSQKNVATGDTITEGQIIGVEGSTGISTGSHLHYQVSLNGNYLDPEAYLNGGFRENTSLLDTVDTDSGGGMFSGIASKIIQILAVVLVLVFAVYLFMKAFDISII